MDACVNPAKGYKHPTAYSENIQTRSECQGYSALDISDISEKSIIRVYPHCVEYTPILKKRPCPRRFPAPRGQIKSFTKKARFRLFVSLAKLDDRLKNPPLFITLTFHHGYSHTDKSAVEILHHFFVRLRQLDKEVQYIWRMELQKRGAPHFHMILFPDDIAPWSDIEGYQIDVARLWHEVADPNSKSHEVYGAKIVQIKSYSAACAYVSKYVGKIEADQFNIVGMKHWGCSRNLPFREVTRLDCTLKEGRAIIEKFRQWLLSKGKSQYEVSVYFHERRDQIIFINLEELNALFNRPSDLLFDS